ncbi:CAP domain-containing protein [Candidatus Saccharibacteria bacterium]|nr:CAP domain-containing protein [Candidatus Saccharibacteria bacterium]
MVSMLKQTRIHLLLSLNAVAIVIAGIVIAGAIWIPKETTLHVVSERSDDVEATEESQDAELLDPATDYLEEPVHEEVVRAVQKSTGTMRRTSGGSFSMMTLSTDPVPSGELWNETNFTIYQTAEQDICVSGTLANLGDMYWQTSNPGVVEGFYQARTNLGYSNERCRFPKIVGTGTTTITAGTYDGSRRDTIELTIAAVPVAEWKQEILNLVNKERAKAGLASLSWASTCEGAAQTRALEIMSVYSHTRPDGSEWKTACPIPEGGGYAGENLAGGISAVSPPTVVASWMNSPEHRANILNANYTKLAVGFVYDANSQYKTYWSQYFTTY